VVFETRKGVGGMLDGKNMPYGVFLLFEMRGMCSNTRTRPEGHVLVFKMEEGEGRCLNTRTSPCGLVLVFETRERKRGGA